MYEIRPGGLPAHRGVEGELRRPGERRLIITIERNTWGESARTTPDRSAEIVPITA